MNHWRDKRGEFTTLRIAQDDTAVGYGLKKQFQVTIIFIRLPFSPNLKQVCYYKKSFAPRQRVYLYQNSISLESPQKLVARMESTVIEKGCEKV